MAEGNLFSLLIMGIEEARRKAPRSLGETMESGYSLSSKEEAIRLLKNQKQKRKNGGIKIFHYPANPEFRQCFEGHTISVKRRRRNRKT